MRILILTALLISVYHLNAQKIEPSKTDGDHSKWDKISDYFSPPPKFKDQYGGFRSPLKFYNGREVGTVKDWEKRRTEILERWNSMMGKWPDLLKDQQLTYTDSIEKEGFTQYTVEFNWLPNEKTKGYLLIPKGEGVKPAVITVFY